MQYRKLGKTDLEVSVVAMGCWAIVGDHFWPDQALDDSLATIHAAMECGINFFDTAPLYGNGYSEEILGKILPDHRHDVVIASKVAPDDLKSAKMETSLEASLKRLKTDYLDLLQVHWPNADIPIEQTISDMEKFQKQGKIRYFGVSNFGPKDLHDLLKAGRCESNQLPYSLLWRAVEFEIQDICVKNGVSILTYSPLMQGLLTGKFKSADNVPAERARTRHFSSDRPETRHTESGCETETFDAIDQLRDLCEQIHQPMAQVALAWLLAQPAVTAVIAGARHPDQIAQNAVAADLQLETDTLAELNRITDTVKSRLGPNCDMWQTESRYH